MKKSIIFFYSLIYIFIFSSAGYSAAPVANIISPPTGTDFNTGNTATFVGSASDAEDGTLTGNSLSWFSTLNGAIGTGPTVSVGNLKEGTHTIKLVAQDKDGEVGQATININVTNPPPVVNITSPADKASFTANDKVTFNGNANDPQDGALTGGSLSWTSDINGIIGSGETFTTDTLSIGDHIITLKATDSHGASTTTSVNISITNTKPTATILLPVSGKNFTTGETISFQGRGNDSEDGTIIDNTLSWTSSIDGVLGNGPSLTSNSLKAGAHVITLTVTDSNGLISDPVSVNITITNDSPVPLIKSPATGAVFQEGETITLSGSATDPEDGNIPDSGLAWTSNKDGKIGTGGEIKTTSLSPGPHTITLTATDSDGLSNSASITIIAGNKLPTPKINTPTDKQIFLEGDKVDFYGTATDPEDGNLSGASLVWTSSRDGALGTGSTISKPSLTKGDHVITLTATDSHNASVSTSITIRYGNLPPKAAILKPDDDAEYELGQDVIFHGSGMDTEDGDLTGSSLVWESNNAGFVTQVGTGTSFSVNSLKSGTHEITLIVTDSGNAKDTDKVTIKIKEMTADKSSLNIEVPGTDTFTIIGGTPPFSVFSRRNDVASAAIDERVVTITGKSKGESDIIVTDNVRNPLTIPVIVTEDPNNPPIAEAYLKKDNNIVGSAVTEGDLLLLDASGSNDSDGSIVSYRWELIAGSIPIYLDKSTASATMFTAPPVSGNTKFIFRLHVKDDDGVSAYDDLEFVITEKNDSYDGEGSDIIPINADDNQNYMGVKYISGLTKAVAKQPGADSRNKPSSFKYKLVEMQANLTGSENAARFIVYLPSPASSGTYWFQENAATGWQNLSNSASPTNDGAYFNGDRNQVIISIKDNGDYDLNPSDNVVRTVSGLGTAPGSGSSSSSGGGSSGGCFIKSLW